VKSNEIELIPCRFGRVSGAVLSSIPHLEELRVKIKESTLSDQLLGGILPKLRKLGITGSDLRKIDGGALEGLENCFHMDLAITHTSIEEIPPRIFDLLQNQAWARLDLSFNKMSSLDSAALYPNKTIWFSKGTKILEGMHGQTNIILILISHSQNSKFFIKLMDPTTHSSFCPFPYFLPTTFSVIFHFSSSRTESPFQEYESLLGVLHFFKPGAWFGGMRLLWWVGESEYKNPISGVTDALFLLVTGGLILDGNEFICDCDLVWIGEWLRRWLRESFQSHSTPNILSVHSVYETIRRPTCTDSKGKRVPLIELYSDVMCHASALSGGGSTAIPTSTHIFLSQRATSILLLALIPVLIG